MASETQRQFGLRDWLSVLGRLFRRVDERNLSLISAGVAFYFMLAIFPALAAAIAVWGLVADPAFVESQLQRLEPIVPEQAFAILDERVRALIATSESSFGWTFGLSLGVTLWTSRAGMAALVRGLNAVYGEDNRGHAIYRIARAILLTATLIGMGLVALLAVLVVPGVLAFLPLGPFAQAAAEVIRWILAGLLLVIGLGFIYRYGPNRRGAQVRWLSAGSVAAILIWGAGSYGLTVYFRNFGNFHEVYGSLGAVAILLIWFYLSAFAVLLGAQLNAELELQTSRDTTVGPARPPGERGAFVADHVAGEEGPEPIEERGG